MRPFPFTVKTLVTSALIMMSGCAEFQLPQLPTLPAPYQPKSVWTDDSVETICARAHAKFDQGKGRRDVQTYYSGKMLFVSAVFNSFTSYNNLNTDEARKRAGYSGDVYSGIFVHTDVNHYLKDVNINLQTEGTSDAELAVMKSFRKGARYQMAGTIEHIALHPICSIILRDFRFSRIEK